MRMDIESIVNSLLVKYPLFGSIIADTRFKKDDSIKTASTDGRDVFYNEQFVSNLSEEQQVFVFAHEICHIAFDHIYRSKNRDMDLWNIATDSVINALLKDDGLEVLESAIYNPDAINYNAEQLYEKLLESKKNNPNNKQNIKCHDDHSIWGKVVEESKEITNKNGDKPSKEDHIKKLTKAGEKKAFEKNKEVRNAKLGELMDSLTEGAIGTGGTTSSLDRLIANVGNSKPLIDWRRALRESLTYDVDWSYANATVEDGVVCAHLEEKPFPVTEIVLDTSGSISENLLRNFLRECKNIIKTSKVKVGCFDTAFYGFTEIKGDKDIDRMNFRGGGGTDFDVAVNAFSKRSENKIIFTDGCARVPSKKCNVIWVVFGGHLIKPNGGKVIYIDDKQLKVLNSINIKKR